MVYRPLSLKEGVRFELTNALIARTAVFETAGLPVSLAFRFNDRDARIRTENGGFGDREFAS